MLSEILRTLGYTVPKYAMRSMLKDLTQDDAFDLVLTDVVMPGMSGYDLVRNMELKNIDIPAIMMMVSPAPKRGMIRSIQ